MDTFCDIIVTCGSVVFPLHLFILASKSTYFKKEFCHIDGIAVCIFGIFGIAVSVA